MARIRPRPLLPRHGSSVRGGRPLLLLLAGALTADCSGEQGDGALQRDEDVFPPPLPCDTYMRPERFSVPLCKPKMLLAGAEKSGSTTLSYWIAGHPDTLSIPEGSYLVPRQPRLRMTRYFMSAKENPDRYLSASNFTLEEVMDPAVEAFVLPNRRVHPMVLGEIIIPIKVGGKEVRYWVPHVHSVLDELGTQDEHFDWYLDVFPPVPAPDSNLDELPAELQQNAGKLTVDASPMYMDFEEWGPPFIAKRLPLVRMVFMLRDPVETFWSHVHFHTSISGGDLSRNKKALGELIRLCARELGRAVTGAKKGTGAKKWSEVRKDQLKLRICMDSHGGQEPWGFLWQKAVYAVKMFGWLKAIPQSQIYMVCSEQMWADPVVEIGRLASWLGLRTMSDDFWREVVSYKYIPKSNMQGEASQMFLIQKVKNDGAGPRRQAPDDVRRIVGFFYADSNKALKKKIKQDWSKFGWVYNRRNINDLLYDDRAPDDDGTSGERAEL